MVSSRLQRLIDGKSLTAIRKIPIKEGWLRSNAQSQTAWTIHLKSFYEDYRALTDSEKKEFLREDEDEQIDEDDILTVGERKEQRLRNMSRRMRKVGAAWRSLPLLHKKAYALIARKMNSLPISGMLTNIPQFLSGQVIKKCLFRDWSYVNSAMLRHLKRGSHEGNSKNATITTRGVTFGKETVVVRSYIRIDELCFPSILNRLALGPVFGKFRKKLCKFYDREIVYRTAQKVVIHIASFERLNLLFTIENMSSCLLVDDGKRYMACGKLNISVTSPDGNVPVEAYIISEVSESQERYDVGTKISKRFDNVPFEGEITEAGSRYYNILYQDGDREQMNHDEVSMHKVNQWKLLCKHTDDESYIMMMDAPMWNKETTAYDFKDSYVDSSGKKFSVEMYQPVRIVFWKDKPIMTFWCHRCVVKDDESNSDDDFNIIGTLCT